jgi:hypothetical protein
MAEYLSVNTFGGLNRGNQLIVPITTQNPQYQVMQNYKGMVDLASSSYGAPIVGLITKSPRVNTTNSFASWDKMPADGRSRGLFHFVPNIINIATSNFLMAYQQTTDYTVTKLYAFDSVGNNWYTLYTGATYLQSDMATYNGKVYMLLDGTFLKWNGDITNWGTVAPIVKDKTATQIAIAGAILGWTTGDATVTSTADISAVISSGDWIRSSSSSLYWDEVLSVAAGGLSLELTAASTHTESSVLGGAEKAASFTATTSLLYGAQPWFIKFWKNKCWLAGNGDTLYWSVTGDPENWDDTAGAGSLDLSLLDQEGVSGIEFMDEQLFVFYDQHYDIFKWTGDLDEPIELVRSVQYGCVSHRTLQKIEGGIIYLAPGELRITNGTDDVCLSDQDMMTHFKTSVGAAKAYYYFLDGVYADRYPWAIIDKLRNLYTLVIPATGGNSYTYNFDYKRKVWTGVDYYFDAGHGCQFFTALSSATQLLTSAMQPGKEIYYTQPYGGDSDNYGYIESATFTSGIASKKIKVYWVEFDFHPLGTGGDIDTTISFNYRENLTAVAAANAQTVSFAYALGSYVAYEKSTKRFTVNKIFDTFSWTLAETHLGGGAYETMGLLSWTIAYDLLDTV